MASPCVIPPLPSNGKRLYFKNAFLEWEERSKQETKIQYETKFRVMKKTRYFVNPPKMHTISSGEERLKQFEHVLHNGFELPLNRFQKGFSQICTQALLPLIMGDEDWKRHGPEVLKKRGWKVPKKIAAGLSLRQAGKTTLICRILATLAKIKPGYRIMVASIAQRISDESRLQMLALCAELGLKIVKENQETIWISEDSPDDPNAVITKIGFYPSVAKVDISQLVSDHFSSILF